MNKHKQTKFEYLQNFRALILHHPSILLYMILIKPLYFAVNFVVLTFFFLINNLEATLNCNYKYKTSSATITTTQMPIIDSRL